MSREQAESGKYSSYVSLTEDDEQLVVEVSPVGSLRGTPLWYILLGTAGVAWVVGVSHALGLDSYVMKAFMDAPSDMDEVHVSTERSRTLAKAVFLFMFWNTVTYMMLSVLTSYERLAVRKGNIDHTVHQIWHRKSQSYSTTPGGSSLHLLAGARAVRLGYEPGLFFNPHCYGLLLDSDQEKVAFLQRTVKPRVQYPNEKLVVKRRPTTKALEEIGERIAKRAGIPFTRHPHYW